MAESRWGRHFCAAFAVIVLALVLRVANAADVSCQNRKDIAFLIEFDADPWSPGHVSTFLQSMRDKLKISPNCNRIAIILASTEAKRVLSFDCQTSGCFNRAIRELRLLRNKFDSASPTEFKREYLLQAIKLLSDDTFIGDRKSSTRVVVAVLSSGPIQQNKDFSVEDAFKDVQDVSDQIIIAAVKRANQMKLRLITQSEDLTSMPKFTGLKDRNRINKIVGMINAWLPASSRGRGMLSAALREPFLPLQVDLEQNCNEYLVDIGFLVDSSGSLKQDYDKEKFFVQRLATRFNISEVGSHGGVIIFSDVGYVDTKIKFNDYYNYRSFNEAVQDLPFYGYRTRIDLALKLADKELFTLQATSRPNVKKVLFLITDGRQNPDIEKGVKLSPVLESKSLHDRSIQIFAVGVGKQVNLTELALITRSPERVYTVSNFIDLVSDGFVRSVSQALCKEAEKGDNQSELKEVPCNTTKPIQEERKCNGSCRTCCAIQNIYVNVFNGKTPSYVVQGVQVVQSGNTGPGPISGITFPNPEKDDSNPTAENGKATSNEDVVSMLKKVLPYEKKLVTTIEALLKKANQKPETVINRKRRALDDHQSIAEVISSNGASKFSDLISKHGISRLISKLARHRKRKHLMVFAPSDEAMKAEFGTSLSPQAISLLLQHHVGIRDDESERVMKCADGKHYLKFYSSNLGKKLNPDKVEDALIIKGPLAANDGVVYIISRVLHPSKPSLRELMHRHLDLSTFTALMRGTGLWRDMRYPMRVNNFCVGPDQCVQSDAFRDRYDEVIKRRQYSILAPTNAAMSEYMYYHPNATQDFKALREAIASHVLHGTLLRDSVAPAVARCDASIAKSNIMRCIATANGTDLMTNFHRAMPHVQIISSQRAGDGVLYIVGSFKPMMVKATKSSGNQGKELPIPH